MRRPLPPPKAKPRRRAFHAALARAASAVSSVLSGSLPPEEFRVCDRMRDVSRSFPSISKFPSQARPGLADVCRDCHAACGQANSATPLGTGGALEGVPLPEAQRPSAENTSLRQENKSPSGNRPCHAAIAPDWQTAAPPHNLRRVSRLNENEAWVQPNWRGPALQTASHLRRTAREQAISWNADSN